MTPSGPRSSEPGAFPPAALALAAFAPAGLTLGEDVVTALREAYGSPGRVYHDLTHVEAVAAAFAEASRVVGFEDAPSVYLAILFHDAVYVPGAADNERRSAELARDVLGRDGRVSARRIARVAELVELTAAHGKLTPENVPGGEHGDAALFLDLDMAILAADESTFDAYDAGIAAEHAHLPPELYASGRRAFLQRLLDRPRIFLSAYGHGRFEAKARMNLRRALARDASFPEANEP